MYAVGAKMFVSVRPCLPALLVVVLLSMTSAQDDVSDNRARYIMDIKVPFFSAPSMTCDHPKLNVSESADVRAISWLLPDGTLVSVPEDADPKLYAFTSSAALPLYNLTALEIDEEQFGYYHCVVEYNGDKHAAVIRWGLNVNGADFSELLANYRENAVVGGVAAAALLFLVGGGCLFWNFRYANRNGDDNYENDDDYDDVKKPTQGENNIDARFENAAYTPDAPAAVIDVHM